MNSKIYRRKRYTDIKAFEMENPYSFKNPIWFAKTFKEGKITMQKKTATYTLLLATELLKEK